MADEKQKLPPKTDDHVLEVSLRHVMLAFGGLVIGTLTVSAGIIFTRDYARYRRQKAILDLAKQLLTTMQQDGGDIKSWKNVGKGLGVFRSFDYPKKHA